MSYDIDYVDPTTEVAFECDPFWGGGTHLVEGNTCTSLNITYNYSKFYYDLIDKKEGIRCLYGKSGKDTSDKLYSAIRTLGTERYKGPWYILDVPLLFITQSKNSLPKNQIDWIEKYGDIFKNRKEEILDPQKVKDPILKEAALSGIMRGLLRDGGGYWCPLPGNAGNALNTLLQWTLRYPEGIFRGD